MVRGWMFSSIQVFSIIDSSYHVMKDMKNQTQIRSQGKDEQKQDNLAIYRERFSLNIPYIGISVIDSYPQVH